MTTKIKITILTIAITGLLILPVSGLSEVAGFSRSAPVNLYTSALTRSEESLAPEPLLLSDERGEYPLGLHLEILEDPSGELTIEEVTSPEFDSQFVPSQTPVPNYGFTDSAYWVRFNVQNETPRTDYWLLEQGFANMHYVDLYTPLPDGEGFAVKQTGVLRPTTTRDITHPRIIFYVTIPPQSQQTIYLRFQNGASMTLPLTLWTQTAFLNRSMLEQIFMGVFYGMLIGLLFYNLFLLFSLRELNYLFFVILLISLIFEDASYAGYLPVYIIPNFDIPVQYIEPMALPLLIGSMILFSDSFLELKRRLPKLHAVFLVLLAVWGALMLLIPFASYHILANLMAPWSVVSLLAVFIAGIASWVGGYRPSRFFLLAWLGLLISMIWVFLVRLGLASSSLLSENAFRLGFLWMAVCWSIALADRINLLKAETENANLALHNSEHKLSQVLEGLPLGVAVYGRDRMPSYANRRSVELLSNPAQGIQADISAGRTLENAMDYFNLQKAGSGQAYPLESFPVNRALQGMPAAADDIEANLGGRRVPLEVWASPVRDEAGNVESAVVAFQDITGRKQAEAELDRYRQNLEALVGERTAELNTANEQLRLHLEWLSAVNLVNQVMARSADFTQIYQKIIEIINHLFVTQGSFISEWEAGSRQLKILAHSCRCDLHPDLAGSITVLPESDLFDSVLEGGKLASISRDQLGLLNGPMGQHMRDMQIQGLALVPLQLREQRLGFLGIEFLEEGRIITNEESNLLGIFSIDIAQIIEDSHLYGQTKALIAAEERNRLARDLHDSVTQTLFTVTLLADVLPQIWRRDPQQGLQRLDKLRRLTRGALAEMRTMLLELRPSAVINTPLADLLAQLTEAIASRSGLPFQLYLEQIPSLPEEVQINFYRIAQEALNNVVKHAQARQVTVSLSATPVPPDSTGGTRRQVKLAIQDDGVGFSPGLEKSTRLGKGIMHERAVAIQASLILESRPGYGTQVTLIWRSDTGSLS